MANVLPPQQRLQLQWHHRMRMLTTMAIMITVTVGIGSTLLIPAYIEAFSQTRISTLNNTTQKYIQKSLVGNTNKVTEQHTTSVVAYLDTADTAQASSGMRDLLNIWQSFSREIAIRSFSIKPSVNTQEGSKASSSIQISGIARNRIVLNAFIQQLKQDASFSQVSFPLSDLVRVKEITFSITTRYTP